MIIKKDNIPFLEGYFISKNGRLWSRYDKSGHLTKDSWHRVKYNTSKGGYKFIQRKGKIYYIHRLVAMTYIPNPENKAYVCHKDNVRTNNHYKNLYWGTAKDNMSQASRDGRMLGPSTSLENHSRSKLTNHQRIRIIYLYKNTDFTYRQLAKKFNVSVGCISSVIKNPNCIKLYEKKYQ